MACKVNRNDKGAITDILTSNNNRSILFDSINSNVFVPDPEVALGIYMNSQSEKITNMVSEGKLDVDSNSEPKLYYQAQSGEIFDNVEELLITDNQGEVKVGFYDSNLTTFTPVAKLDTEGSEKNTFISDQIRQGLLSANKVQNEEGKMVYQGKGEFDTTRHVTAIIVKDQVQSQLGIFNVEIGPNGTLDFDTDQDFVSVIDEDGTVTAVRLENIPESITDTTQNKAELMLQYTLAFNDPIPLTKKSPKNTKVIEKVEDVKGALMDFLESLGFTTSTLENYAKNYNIKHGTDPDVQALADMANRVVAFREGKIPLEDLSEEVAHIAIEAFSDQNSIASALVNVHLTPEYKEHSDFYRSKYSETYEGTALEDQVRKEVLGKILKKEFLNRFSTAEKSNEEVYLTDILKRIWQNFKDYISAIIKPYHRTALDNLNKRIANSVLNNNTNDFKNDFSDGGIFFNASNTRSNGVATDLKASKRFIEDLFRKALNQPVPNQAELDKIAEAISTVDTLDAVNTIVGIVENQLDVLQLNVEDSLSKGEIMTKEDSSRYHILKNNLLPSINKMKSEIKKASRTEKDKRLKSTAEILIKAIESANIKISEVEPLVTQGLSDQADKLVDQVIEDFSIDDKLAEEVRNNVEGGFKDIGFMGFKFGLASHSKNILIQLLHREFIKITTFVNSKFNRKYNDIITYIQDKGLLKYQNDIINTDADGKATYYFLSPTDEHWYDTELRKKENEEIARLTGKSVSEVEKLRKSLSPIEIVKDEVKLEEYKENVKIWRDTVGSERRFSDKYYIDRDARFDKANVSKETRKYLANKNTARFSRARKYMDKDGSIDRSKMTEAEKVEDRNDFKNHVKVKSAYNANGDIKIGLKRVRYTDLTVEERANLPIQIDPDYTGDVTILDSKMSLEDLPVESRRALDLFNLDMLYRQENKDKVRESNPIKRFKETIDNLKRQGINPFDWVSSNASINLTSEYYESMGIGKTYEQIAEEYFESLDPSTAASKRILLEGLQDLQRKRKDILKQNRKAESIIETDVHHMTTPVRERLLELEDEISETKRSLDIPFELFEDSFSESGSEIMLNSDFDKMLIESGKTAFDFSLKHMSKRNQVKVQDFANQIDDFIGGRRSHIKPHFDRFLAEQLATDEYANLNKQDIIQKLKDEYAKRNIAKYFLRNEPKGYSELLAAMEDGSINLSDFIDNKANIESQYPAARFVEIIPEYSWSDDISNEEYINKSFKPNAQGKQVKKLNDKFFNYFGISKEEYLNLEDDDLSKLTPTKNKEAYELLKIVTSMREEAIENYGDTGKVSKYLRVQLSKDNFEKVKSLHRGTVENIKDFFTDFADSKVDEKEYGEELEDSGIGIKSIPKYYQNKLESADLLTNNILHASMLDLKASLRFDERHKAEGNVRALEYKVSQQKFKNQGGNSVRSRILKKGEVSNYYSKFQEMADHGLYGVRESRKMIVSILGKEVDLTQMFSKFTKYISNLNLGYNIIADATSYATGVYNNAVDALVGDYYHKTSVIKATRDLPLMIAKYVSETGAVQKESELSHWMEFFNIQDAEDKLNQSSSGRLVRMVSKSAFGASKLANLGVTPKNMLIALHDHKFYNGRFQSSREFERNMRIENSKMTKAEINARWNKLNDSLYDNLVIDKKKGVLPGENFKSKFGGNYQEVLDNLQVKLTNKITQINQSIDGVISASDQTAAQRDVITNALLLHRGWFIINLTRKFKGRHFNIATGQIDSGHYMNVLKSILKITKGTFKGNLREVYNTMESHEARNLKRIGIDTIGIIILTSMVNMLLEGDDEDDTYAEDFAQLIALRLVGETQSQGLVGIIGSSADMYENPVVQTSTLKNFSDAYKAYKDEDDEKLKESLLKNLVPTKRYYQYSDLKKQLDNYRYHNKETLLGVEGVMED